MRRFANAHPVWSAIIVIAALVLLWMIFAIWPDGLVDAIGRKKVFLNALFNGITTWRVVLPCRQRLYLNLWLDAQCESGPRQSISAWGICRISCG